MCLNNLNNFQSFIKKTQNFEPLGKNIKTKSSSFDHARLTDEQARLKQRQEELERLRRQMEINEAAVKIQSTYRGYRDRQRVMAMESVLTGYDTILFSSQFNS